MKLFKQLIDYCTRAKSLFWLALFVLALPNLCLFFTERMPLSARLANVLFPVPVYALLLLLLRRTGKQIWILFPLVFFSAFQMVLLYLYGHSVIAVDMFLNLVTTNSGEALELLGNLLPGMLFVIVVYVPLLVFAVVSWARRVEMDRQTSRRYRLFSSYAALVGLAVLLSAKLFSASYSVLNSLYPVNVFYNLWLAIERSRSTVFYYDSSRNFKFHARATHPESEREVYVLVVGETARACNFELYGYQRETNPELRNMRGMVAFDKALTQSNTTHKSVPMLLSEISAANYDSIYVQKGIITAFKEAGFHTVFLSNQMPNHSFIDFFGEEADEWHFIKENPDDVGGFDDALLPMLGKILKKERRKEFIVLHTYGSHFNYQERYPRNMAFYAPDGPADAKADNRPELINAYDNTIRYTDHLVASVMRKIQRSGATGAVLYTSDHGENVFDDSRKLFLHASPIPSYYELHVPLVVWLSPAYRSSYGDVERHLLRNRHKRVATNESVFHTLIDLAGIRTPLLNRRRSVASADYAPGALLYLDDHNEALPVGDILVSEHDVELLGKIGVKVKLKELDF